MHRGDCERRTVTMNSSLMGFNIGLYGSSTALLANDANASRATARPADGFSPALATSAQGDASELLSFAANSDK